MSFGGIFLPGLLFESKVWSYDYFHSFNGERAERYNGRMRDGYNGCRVGPDCLKYKSYSMPTVSRGYGTHA